MNQGLKDMAQRIVNAENNFAGMVAGIAGITIPEAEKVTAFYLKKKLAKLDPVGGRITVKHGGCLDADAIGRALVMANEGAKK